MIYKNVLKSLLFTLDPETAHEYVMWLAKRVNDTEWLRHFVSVLSRQKLAYQPVHFRNLTFRNPIGLAAGFDKNGVIPKAIHALGFGFTEIGSITARASSGNPKPRMFRLPEDQALINRMGLNNEGALEITKRLQNLAISEFPIGINISKTHDPKILGLQAIEDYAESFVLAEPVAQYITINISCPNTKEGKTFEDIAALTPLLQRISEIRKKPDSVPVLIKVSSDISESDVKTVAKVALDYGMDGFVAVNTSTSRTGLRHPEASLQQIGNGGLSGTPVFEKMRSHVATLRSFAGSDVLIIGVGGIDSAVKTEQTLQAGANLIQMYTGLVYEGPFLPSRIVRTLSRQR